MRARYLGGESGNFRDNHKLLPGDENGNFVFPR